MKTKLGIVLFLMAISFGIYNIVSASILYSQSDHSTEIPAPSIGAFPVITDSAGHISKIEFAYNDHGQSTGHYIGLSVVDLTLGINYYAYNPSLGFGCADVYQSQGTNTKTIVTLDNSWEYRAYPCTGGNLTLDSTHAYGISLFMNRGGANTQRFYGKTTNPNDLYLLVENDSTPEEAAKEITAFTITNISPNASAIIDHEAGSIVLNLHFGTNITDLAPSITINGASVVPASGLSQDFTNTVLYTVTAQDGGIKRYRAKVVFTCLQNCVSNTVYSQPNHEVEIPSSSVSTSLLFTGASGTISKLQFAYHDHGESTGHFIGLSIVDYTAGTQYYGGSNGTCGDAYESKGINAKVIVTLDSSTKYREYSCGQELVLDPTHTYGVNIFRNHGGNNASIQRFYGASTSSTDLFLNIETFNATEGCVPGTEGCNSNVLFLPGIQGSRLYETAGSVDCSLGLTGDCFREHQLWLPVIDEDVEKLYMSDNGSSINQTIYTKDAIDVALGLVNIYDSLLVELDKWKNDEQIIEDYSVVPYDWRLPPSDIVNNGKKTADNHISYTRPLPSNETPFLISEVERLATDSRTGKVTIVAHSMGGLVTKELMLKLRELGKEDLVDQIIFVSVPEVGTPDAVKALLHGISLGYGFIADSKLTRDFGRNLQTAYDLLPSRNYFNTPVTSEIPVASFDGSPYYLSTEAEYGPGINNFSELNNYLKNQEGRPNPAYSDLNHAGILQNTLVDTSDTLHQRLDAWEPASTTKLIEIAGWGEYTLAGINYRTEQECVDKGLRQVGFKLIIDCYKYKDKQVLGTTETLRGDGTVVNDSAHFTANKNLPNVEKWWLDLEGYNDAGPFGLSYVNRDHKNILEVENVVKFIKSKLKNENLQIPYMYLGEPISNKQYTKVELNSPLALDLYDSLGNHTGLVPNNTIEENIPGTRYKTIGESKYVYIPKDTAVTVKLDGYAEGSFSISVTDLEGDAVVDTKTFSAIPSNENTLATINIPANTSVADLPPLSIDFNGDLIVDTEIDITENGVYDVTPPEIQMSFNFSTNEVEFKGLDENTVTTVHSNTSTIATDNQGNASTLYYTRYKEKPTRLKLTFNTIDRNGVTTIFPNTHVTYDWDTKDGDLIDLDTKVVVKGVEKYIFNYKKKQNVTVIKVKTGDTVTTTTRTGFVGVTINTNEDEVLVNY